jgi:periplasmic protein TonB
MTNPPFRFLGRANDNGNWSVSALLTRSILPGNFPRRRPYDVAMRYLAAVVFLVAGLAAADTSAPPRTVEKSPKPRRVKAMYPVKPKVREPEKIEKREERVNDGPPEVLEGEVAGVLGGVPDGVVAGPPPEPIIPPRPVDDNVMPAYPPEARASGKPATVTLQVTVGTRGNSMGAWVREGEEPFASAAVAAANKWRFTPATRGGKPVIAGITMTVSFKP